METFLHNLTYLEPRVKVMKGLLSSLGKRTVRQSFMSNFNDVAHLVIEEKEAEFHPLQDKSSPDTAYKQLWLYGMRHFPEMVEVTPRRELGQPSPSAKEPGHWYWYQFASLAQRVGFETGVKEDPER